MMAATSSLVASKSCWNESQMLNVVLLDPTDSGQFTNAPFPYLAYEPPVFGFPVLMKLAQYDETLSAMA